MVPQLLRGSRFKAYCSYNHNVSFPDDIETCQICKIPIITVGSINVNDFK